MLERAASYVEPASQVLFQRCEPPLRSSRLLGRGFFKHAGSISEPPPWWPLYLDSVRQIPYSNSSIVVAPHVEAICYARNTQSRTTKQALSSSSVPLPNIPTSVRPFSGASTLRNRRSLDGHGQELDQVNDVDEDQDDEERQNGLDGETWAPEKVHDLYQDHMDKHLAHGYIGTDQQAVDFPENPFGARETFGEHTNTSSYSDAHRESRHGPQTSGDDGLDSNQARLEHLLEIPATSLKGSAAKLHYRHVWTAFIAIPDQETYASKVTAHLSSLKNEYNCNKAILAFGLTPKDTRSAEDYNTFVDVAAWLKRISPLLRMCQEASERGMADLCRQTAIVRLMRLNLWKSVARVWGTCFGNMHLHPGSGSVYCPISSVRHLDLVTDLPALLLKLCKRLTASDSFDDQERENLLQLARGLSWRVVASGHLMSAVTLEGLLSLFQSLTTIGLLRSGHHATAIQTLCSATQVMRPRHNLAIRIYQDGRQRFPHQKMPTKVLHGLLHLCLRAEEKLPVFEYLFEEMRTLPAKSNYVLPTRADYLIALRALSAQGNVHAVEKIYTKLLADHGNLEHHHELIPSLYVHAVTGNISATQQTFDNLELKHGIAPNTVCWNVLILAASRSATPQKAFGVLDEMVNSGIEPNAYTYSTLISVCAKRGDLANVLKLLETATQLHFTDIRMMLASLVHAYCLNDELEQAETLVANLNEFEMQGSPAPIWTELLKYHAYRKDLHSLRRVWKQMLTAGVEPDEYCYACEMVIYIRQSRTSKALDRLRSLHFESRIVATPFLYSLILLGFEREGNRDMVSLIHRELQDRYPGAHPSADLTKLRAEIRSSVGKARQKLIKETTPGRMHQPSFLPALKFLESLEDQDSNVAASKTASAPQLGFYGEAAFDGAHTIYSRTLSETFAQYGRGTQARGILDWGDHSGRSIDVQRPESVRMLTTRLLVAREQNLWEEVDDLWRRIIQQALEKALSLSVLRDNPIDLTFSSSDPRTVMRELKEKMNSEGLSVLRAQRFALSLPLQRYMIGLDRQRRHEELREIVEILQDLGFRLTGSNWNIYVQSLCNSSNREDRLTAFSIYATIQFPHMPTYMTLDKQRWIDPKLFEAAGEVGKAKLPSMTFRQLARTHPDVTPPSYITTVRLLLVLLDFEKLAQEGDDHYMRHVHSQYPEAYKRIIRMPKLPDRVQRVLLIGKRPYQPPKMPETPKIDHGGVLGSRSILDLLPLGALEWGKQVLQTRPAHDNPSEEQLMMDIVLAEAAFGEIAREPLYLDREYRWETPLEQANRVRKVTNTYRSSVRTAAKLLNESALTIGHIIGDPASDLPLIPEHLQYDERSVKLDEQVWPENEVTKIAPHSMIGPPPLDPTQTQSGAGTGQEAPKSDQPQPVLVSGVEAKHVSEDQNLADEQVPRKGLSAAILDLEQETEDIAANSVEAAKLRANRTPPYTIKHGKALRRRFLPPKRKSDERRFATPKARRHAKRAQASLQRALDEEYAEHVTEQRLPPDNGKQAELSLYQLTQESIRTDAETAEEQSRRARAAKEAQLQRLQSILGSASTAEARSQAGFADHLVENNAHSLPEDYGSRRPNLHGHPWGQGAMLQQQNQRVPTIPEASSTAEARSPAGLTASPIKSSSVNPPVDDYGIREADLYTPPPGQSGMEQQFTTSSSGNSDLDTPFWQQMDTSPFLDLTPLDSGSAEVGSEYSEPMVSSGRMAGEKKKRRGGKRPGGRPY